MRGERGCGELCIAVQRCAERIYLYHQHCAQFGCNRVSASPGGCDGFGVTGIDRKYHAWHQRRANDDDGYDRIPTGARYIHRCFGGYRRRDDL